MRLPRLQRPTTADRALLLRAPARRTQCHPRMSWRSRRLKRSSTRETRGRKWRSCSRSHWRVCTKQVKNCQLHGRSCHRCCTCSTSLRHRNWVKADSTSIIALQRSHHSQPEPSNTRRRIFTVSDQSDWDYSSRDGSFSRPKLRFNPQMLEICPRQPCGDSLTLHTPYKITS